MATSIRAVASNSSATGTAVSVSAPTGTTAGDVVVCILSHNDSGAFVDNNGLTPFTDDGQINTAGNTATMATFSRRIVGGDPSTYNFTYAVSSTRWTAIALCFQNPNATTIYDVAPTYTASAAGASTSANAPNITTLTANAIHIASCQLDRSTGFTSHPTGYNTEADVAQQRTSVESKTIATPSATGTGVTWGWTTGEWFFVESFAIKDIGTVNTRLLAAMGVGR